MIKLYCFCILKQIYVILFKFVADLNLWYFDFTKNFILGVQILLPKMGVQPSKST